MPNFYRLSQKTVISTILKKIKQANFVPQNKKLYNPPDPSTYTGSANSNWCIFLMIRWHYDKNQDIFEILR